MPGKTLEIDTTPEEKLAVLKAAAEHFNSDLTQIVCRDKDDKLLSVSVHARGECAEELSKFLQSKKFSNL